LDANIEDIFIFGSLVKNGLAKDIDLALLLKEKVNLPELKKKIQVVLNLPADIQVLTLNSVYSSLWLTLLKEGYSVKEEKFLAELYGIKPMVLYKYSLTSLNAAQRVQFSRAVKSVLKTEGHYLTRSVLLVPLALRNQMVELLKAWKIYYEAQEYELIPLLRKEEL
jgi:predicted nucleotidyltransferase